MKEVLKNQKGVLWVTLSYLLLPFGILALAIQMDFARPLWVEAQLQTAADAGALAGALTAEAFPEKEVEVQYDASGNIIGINERIVGWKTDITDPEKAYHAAKEAVQWNTQWLSSREGGFTMLEAFNPDEDLSGEKLTNDSYLVNLKAHVATLLMGKIQKAYGQAETDQITVKVTGVGQAFPVVEP